MGEANGAPGSGAAPGATGEVGAGHVAVPGEAACAGGGGGGGGAGGGDPGKADAGTITSGSRKAEAIDISRSTVLPKAS
jgi:hypothetical protein